MGNESSLVDGVEEKPPLEEAITQLERCIKIKAQIEEDIQLTLRKLQGLCEQLGEEKHEEKRLKTKVQTLREKETGSNRHYDEESNFC